MAPVVVGPYLTLSIVVGLILAVGFQLVLTNLSFAAGLSALRVGPASTETEEEGSRTGLGAKLRTATSSVGLWALVTASIALFFGSWLAVTLSLVISPVLAAIIGLAIWALFMLVFASVQATAAWSLVGSLLRTVVTGIRGAWGGMSGLFARSDEARAADAAARVTRAVKEELLRDVRVDRIRDELRSYVRQLAPHPLDPSVVRREVQALLDETEVESIEVHEGAPVLGESVVSVLRAKKLPAREVQDVAHAVDDALRVIKEEAFSGKDKVSTVADTALRLTGRSREEAIAARNRVEEWLRATGKEELDPDGIKRDLERLVTEPGLGLSALRERARMIDRETVEAVLSRRSDISPEDAHRIVETVERWVNAVLSRGSTSRPDLSAARERVETKVRAYLDSLDRPELDYDGIKHDVERLLEEPGVGAEALADRVKAIDRDTVKAILASRRDIDEEKAERILRQVEAARDAVSRRARALRDEVERRMLAARDEALRRADEARKTAATAAWWSVATAVVAAIAAVLGGMAAVAVG